MQRIHFMGGSGSGKSTLGRAVAARLGLPFFDLDDLYWEPGWREVGHPELARRLAPIVVQPGWVIAGNYHATTEVHVWPRLTQLVLLDLPYLTLLRRAAWRTLVRGITGTPCCNGNTESLWRAFHPEGVMVHMTLNWRRRHRRYAGLQSEAAVAHAQVLRLRSPAQVQAWADALG